MGLYEFERPDEPLEFTGERYTSAVENEVEHEHLHRYLLALRWCEGRRVVDVACGEGYGAALLGTVATEVVGVDADDATVEYATRHHGSETVRFHVSDAAAVPVEDGWADVVVSFETIEHLDDHDAFLAEVLRVLRPGGLLVLSTPDRTTYLAGPESEPNPFHAKELDRAELTGLLEARFAHVAVGGQRSDRGSTIAFPGSTQTFFDREGEAAFSSSEELPAPVYLVALATDGDLPELGPSTLLDRDYMPFVRGVHLHELAAQQERMRDLEDAESDLVNARRQLEAAAERERMLEQAMADHGEALNRLNSELEQERADAESARERGGPRSAQLEREVASLQRELDEIRSSRLWRLLAPLRTRRRKPAHVPPPAPVREESRGRTPLEELPPAPATLLRFPDDDGVPAEIRDNAIVARANAWAAARGPSRAVARLARRPLMSVLMPVYDTPPGLLEAAVRSVLAQSYPEWELVIVDDASPSPLDPPLAEIAGWDPRIRTTRLPRNRGVSEATNAALHLARGDFVAMLDHDDELHEDALLEIARALDADPALDAVYTDQESIEADGTPAEPFLKPDWSPTFLCGVMYVGHLLAVRRELAVDAGGFDRRFDNVQDFELMLRLSERTDRIGHVPKVLYRWRRVPGSIALAGDAKEGVEQLQAAAVTAHLERLGVPARARPHPTLPHRAELVPLDGKGRVEVVVLQPGVPLHEAVAGIDAELLVTIESGVEPEGEDWLAQLALHARTDGVAAVSPLVLGPVGPGVEDAGLVIGPDGELVPAMRGWDSGSDGYAGSLAAAREVTAVSGACAMIATATLERLGGFSDLYANPAPAWRDLALRARAEGLRNVVTPRAVVRRTGTELPPDPLDRRLLRDAWSEALVAGDPYAGGRLA